MSGSDTRIVLVGAGRMGAALLQGWLAADLVGAVDVIEPAEARPISDPRVRYHADPTSVAAGPAALILAIKPQIMASAVPGLAALPGDDTPVLSVAAGIGIDQLSGWLGGRGRVIRVMPNTPAQIGKGVSVCCPQPTVTPAQKALCDALMQAVGAVHWIAEEKLMDAVTALSGSGPAYVFLLIEALAEAGAAEGLPADLALALARETVEGAGALAALPDALAPGMLRENVTSPGGTTAAALAVLMGEGGLRPLIRQAVAAAAARGRELGR